MSVCELETAVVHTGARRGPVLTTREAARYCGLAYQTLRNLLAAGDGPKKFKQGALNVFYSVDLDAWLATRITDPDEAAAS
ncbi:helix-turn-helix domain-containing protein [Microbacterium paraoxydans]|uniref:helix-turn-helix domain-containing protein n=1 Tax=Microbacterium paraoxydans TaxID=199592 RepID=UPI0004681636|nr:helix-turn-helix domain-containing protein [Microbacterium paraoxydans]